MKIECLKDHFEEAVTKIVRFTSKNESLPVLECIYLEARKSEFLLRATNLDIGIEVKVPAKVLEDGQTAVPGAPLRNLLINMTGEKKVILETSRENLLISSSKNTSLLKSYKTEDFPIIPKASGNEIFTIPLEILKTGIMSVWYSASTSFVKPEIASIYIYREGEDLIFVATDSFRLAERRIPLKSKINFSSIIIPYRNLVEIMRVLENLHGSLEVNANKNQISITSGNIYLTSRLVDGTFPDYKQIIPKNFTTEVITLSADLLNALKITNIFSDKFFKVLFKVDVKTKRFEVEARNADIGENTTQVDSKISGENILLGFNYRYIIDMLQSIKEDSVSLEFSGEGKALVMKGVGDNTFTYLVMPMNH